jgi:hypothetical protein
MNIENYGSAMKGFHPINKLDRCRMCNKRYTWKRIEKKFHIYYHWPLYPKFGNADVCIVKDK